MQKQEILNALTPQIVDKFRTAIEIGKWEDGHKLSDEQRQICLQAVMIWEHENLPIHERIGYITRPVDDEGEMVGADCQIEHDQHYPNLPNPKGAIQPVSFKKSA